jgi:hypothetical protein
LLRAFHLDPDAGRSQPANNQEQVPIHPDPLLTGVPHR